MNKSEEGFRKLVEIIEEQQSRIENLEKNFVSLVRILKKFTDRSAVPERQPPPPTDA